MTRIDAGALEVRRDWIDLREVVLRVANAAKRRGTSLRFSIDLPTELLMIAADAILVEQAFSNVVNNASLHTPAGTHLVIDAIATVEAVSIRFTDDGPGIPADVLPHVFDKFVRARGARADKGEGTGLGLAIAKGIITAHGGSIAAESPVSSGAGARITMTFLRESPQ
jgi:two-component system sensor histidine kinase KdpD